MKILHLKSFISCFQYVFSLTVLTGSFVHKIMSCVNVDLSQTDRHLSPIRVLDILISVN